MPIDRANLRTILGALPIVAVMVFMACTMKWVSCNHPPPALSEYTCRCPDGSTTTDIVPPIRGTEGIGAVCPYTEGRTIVVRCNKVK